MRTLMIDIFMHTYIFVSVIVCVSLYSTNFSKVICIIIKYAALFKIPHRSRKSVRDVFYILKTHFALSLQTVDSKVSYFENWFALLLSSPLNWKYIYVYIYIHI